jgi:hypothetical protein
MIQRSYNSDVDSMDANGLITFEIGVEEQGGFSACARVGTWSLITQGEGLDELHSMIKELVDVYNGREERKITAYALKFDAAHPVAA